MKQSLFAPPTVVDSERHLVEAESIENLITKAEGLESVMPRVLSAKKISEDIGYIRIYTFNLSRENITNEQFISEFIRLVMQLPKRGLIIDVRANGGGSITAAERLLQLLTPQEIIPEPFQFMSSPLILEMTRSISDPVLKPLLDSRPWKSSLSESVATGSIFSRGFTITDISEANDLGQRYHGPTVLITDALCYSATDLFAAGFQDHKIGPILGIDGNTGAGGANVWNYTLLRRALAGTKYELKKLPENSFRVSIRRNVRVGERAGTPIENLGIKPDNVHNMTRRDLLEQNEDLIKKASEILAGMPVRLLDVELSKQDSLLEIQLSSLGITRVDLYIDGRPVLSQDVVDGTNKLRINKPGANAQLLKILGLKDNNVVAATRVLLYLIE